MTSKTGYMAFMGDTPMIGLDPHPGSAPMDTPPSFDAAGWFEAYGGETDLQALERELADDHRARLEDVASGDLEDCDEEPDFALPVRVEADGTLHVFAADGETEPMRSYTVADVYGAYGMAIPGTP